MKLSDIGEFGLIGRIADRVSYHDGVAVGIGDDAAATIPTPGTVTLTTSDMLVEGIHFNLAWTDPFSLGKKSLSVNLSDVAAMGAVPTSFLLSLAISPSLSVEFIERFIAGILKQAEIFGVSLIGGDTCASRGDFVISLTLMGEQRLDRVVRRCGAMPGDLVCVTGTLGDSALGLELLRRGNPHGAAVERHLDPLPRVREGIALAEQGLLTAMIDVSDGLLADLGHIIANSKVGARIDTEKLPLSAHLVEQSGMLSLDPVVLALSGGEDYELLFTVRPEAFSAVERAAAEMATSVTVVGEISDTGRLEVVGAGGKPYPITRVGYNHFS